MLRLPAQNSQESPGSRPAVCFCTIEGAPRQTDRVSQNRASGSHKQQATSMPRVALQPCPSSLPLCLLFVVFRRLAGTRVPCITGCVSLPPRQSRCSVPMPLMCGFDDPDGEPLLPTQFDQTPPQQEKSCSNVLYSTPRNKRTSQGSQFVGPLFDGGGSPPGLESPWSERPCVGRAQLSAHVPSSLAQASVAGQSSASSEPSAALSAGSGQCGVSLARAGGDFSVRRRVRAKSTASATPSADSDRLLQRVQSYFARAGSTGAIPEGDWRRLRELIRTDFTQKHMQENPGGGEGAASFAVRRTEARAAWASVDHAGKMDVLQEMLKASRVPADLVASATKKVHEFQQREEEDLAQPRGARASSSSILLTWNGPWGELDELSESSTGISLEDVAEVLRAVPAVQFLWKEAQVFVQGMMESEELLKSAVSLELCTRTYEQSGRVRVHLHSCWVSKASRKWATNMTRYCFGDSVPFRSRDAVSNRARGRSVTSAWHAGIYYVVAPKKGSLFTWSSVLPFQDFVVNAEWITVMWQMSKLTNTVACEQYTLCKRDVKRHIQNVRDQECLEREQLLKKRLEEAQTIMAKTLKPRKRIALVDDVWLVEQNEVRDRQRFLVLDGPSVTGKTRFAILLRGAFRTLEVNCAACLREPDLRAFEAGRHLCIVFDEAHCQMVIACKRLFQAPPASVQMAASATNCFGYSVCVHGVLLVVCSNTWRTELQSMSADDRDWLAANSVYVAVEQPLWEA